MAFGAVGGRLAGILLALVFASIIPIEVVHVHQRLLAAGVMPAELSALVPLRSPTAVADNLWKKVCIDGGTNCAIEQSTSIADVQGENAAPLRVTIGRENSDAQWPLVFHLPPGIDARKGIDLQIDNGPHNRPGRVVCDSNACSVSLTIGKGERASLEAGHAIHVAFVDDKGRGVAMTIGLYGLTNALKSLGD
jgi:invasion protein IalB